MHAYIIRISRKLNTLLTLGCHMTGMLPWSTLLSVKRITPRFCSACEHNSGRLSQCCPTCMPLFSESCTGSTSAGLCTAKLPLLLHSAKMVQHTCSLSLRLELLSGSSCRAAGSQPLCSPLATTCNTLTLRTDYYAVKRDCAVTLYKGASLWSKLKPICGEGGWKGPVQSSMDCCT